jgi:serine protease Do
MTHHRPRAATEHQKIKTFHKILRLNFFLFLLCPVFFATHAAAQQTSQSDQIRESALTTPQAPPARECANGSIIEKIANELGKIHEQHRDALVRVRATTRLGIFNGTGFLIDQNGHILTASSLIPEHGEVRVEKDNLDIPATIIGIDRPSSVALLKIDGHNTPRHLQFRSGTALPEGSAVVILGFPFHSPSTPLFAIINGLDRTLPDGKMLCITHHRMNVPLTPGMIGSPVLDSAGQVTGMVTGTAGEGRITYALPTPALRRVLADLAQHGIVRRGWIGMELEERRAVENKKPLIVITKIHPGTPAHTAGLRAGDIVRTLDDREIHDRFDLIEAAFFTHVGQQVPVFITRDGHDHIFHLAIVERPREVPFVEVRKPPVLSRVITVCSEN